MTRALQESYGLLGTCRSALTLAFSIGVLAGCSAETGETEEPGSATGESGGSDGLGNSGGGSSGGTGSGGITASGGTPAAGGTLGDGGTPGAGGAPLSTGGADGDGGTGGAATGGASSGGAGTGGTETCDYPEPPENVAAWIDESWDAQLGGNIEGREAWLLDNIVKGEGEINLCVRWGATSPPSSEVKEKVGPAVERWMNHWFTELAGYGCFPYPEGAKVRVTGWAVPPGNEAWVSDLGESIGVYTETDGDGQPVCPDSCSFFTNWDHEFPSCPGGEAFHTDYWIWVSDALPGSGAAAVGGDWGLRMPVDSFVGSLDSEGSGVIEHEIGHGFGFQDYYDWTGSTPEGGSLMIVGSAFSGTPTVADSWLLRRTWSEMQTIRGW